uniref:Uncharacterized protein n=1 Tax=Esox lucius TaxID=8010 RepID=A0A3P9A2E4_ESOLU
MAAGKNGSQLCTENEISMGRPITDSTAVLTQVFRMSACRQNSYVFLGRVVCQVDRFRGCPRHQPWRPKFTHVDHQTLVSLAVEFHFHKIIMCPVMRSQKC